LLKKNQEKFFSTSFRIALVIGTVGLLAVLLGGDSLGSQVAVAQPAKLAAMESQWETTKKAPIYLVVWPSETKEKNAVQFFGIPGALSLMAFKDVDHEVVGLNDIPADSRPPVVITFVGFRVMVIIGTAMIAVIVFAWLRRKNLSGPRWYLTLLIWFIPMPYIACTAGWITTEVGRQPWLVYNVMRTCDGLTKDLKTSHVAFSLTLLTILLTSVTAIAVKLTVTHCRKGPVDLEE
jgi:cytochrome d ubiquinol oxidase subunit I